MDADGRAYLMRKRGDRARRDRSREQADLTDAEPEPRAPKPWEEGR